MTKVLDRWSATGEARHRGKVYPCPPSHAPQKLHTELSSALSKMNGNYTGLQLLLHLPCNLIFIIYQPQRPRTRLHFRSTHRIWLIIDSTLRDLPSKGFPGSPYPMRSKGSRSGQTSPSLIAPSSMGNSVDVPFKASECSSRTRKLVGWSQVTHCSPPHECR